MRVASLIEVGDQSSEGLEKYILDTITAKWIDMKKCRGQGYDGAAVMSGIYSGVQKRMMDTQPNALYVECTQFGFNA